MQADGAKKLPDSPVSLIRGGKMFSKKKFMFNGKARRKISPSPSPPELISGEVLSLISNTTEMVDCSQFDFMGIEEFLSISMEKSDKSDTVLWSASCVLRSQLKSSRALLSLRSYLSSYDQTISPLDRLIDTAHFILSAESIYILQLDANGIDLVVTHSHTDGVIGLRASVSDVLSGADETYTAASAFISFLNYCVDAVRQITIY